MSEQAAPETAEPLTPLLLPAAAVEVIAVAIQDFQGHTSHADTEARVLREWLAVERDRVNEVLRKSATSV